FGDGFLRSASDNPDLSVFAARRKGDGAVTVALVNKNLGGPCAVRLDLGGLKGDVRAWRFDQDSDDEVREAKEQAGTADGTLTRPLPGASATMLVLTPRTE